MEHEIVDWTADIVAAYVSHNSVPATALPELIASVHATLLAIGSGVAAPLVEAKAEPAVSIRKSITPDYLISLFDGKAYKSLKRHLRTSHDMTPEQYRVHFDLPANYPMTAPNYAATRSALAKASGLGRKRLKPVEPVKPARKARAKKAVKEAAE